MSKQHNDGVTIGSSPTIGNSPVDNEASADLANEADLSVDKVSRLMREQDADLLESMHYAASQVSHYSPDGTPKLRPKDRSLPMEDVPLMMMPLASTSQLLMSAEGGEASSEARKARFGAVEGPLIPPQRSTSRASRSTSRGSTSAVESVGRVTWNEEVSDQELPDHENQQRFRRLLSGEVRTIDMEGEGGEGDPSGKEEEETTASPVSVAQEAATSRKKDEGLAERKRRRNESIQFAEAVGEKFKDELCIIEDDDDDGEEVDSDDDEICESKEIHVDDTASIQETMHSQTNQQEFETEEKPVVPSHVEISKADASVTRKSKARPLWPFGGAGSEITYLDSLSGVPQNNFVYKGICANPPEITKRGIQRGNYAQLHRKAWLEVSDKYHRYGKNLRLYYRYWERLDFPTNQFFDWLDSKGGAAGQPLPNLDECPRSVLDSDTVLYINNPDVTEGYALDIVPGEDGKGLVIDVDGDSINTGSEGWIFVLRDNVMYGAMKITSICGQSKQRFHHSSFFAGKAVASAGIIITDENGYITRLYPHSGHYRPSEAHMQRMLFFLHRKGVDLRTFEVDTQQFRHVSREKDGKDKERKSDEKDKERKSDEKEGEKKVKKVDSLHLEKAVYVAFFLAHKAGFIGEGIFDKIHRIRKADVASVSEALDKVDDGGYWRRSSVVP